MEKKKGTSAQAAIEAAAAAIGKQLQEAAAAKVPVSPQGEPPPLYDAVAALTKAANEVLAAKEAAQQAKTKAAYSKAVLAFASSAKKVLGKSAPGWAQANVAYQEFNKVVALLGLVAVHTKVTQENLSKLVEAGKAVQVLAAQPVTPEAINAVASVASQLVEMSDAQLTAQWESEGDEMPHAVEQAIDAALLAPTKAADAVKPLTLSALEKAVKDYEESKKLPLSPLEQFISGNFPSVPNPSSPGMPKVAQVGGIPDLASVPATQKRAGVSALGLLDPQGSALLGGSVSPASVLAVMSPRRGGYEENEAWLRQQKVEPNPFLRLFFRPCPVTPRHGFVDSRACTTWEEVRAVYEEALAADKDAEVLVMCEIEAESSAITTSTMVAVGPGHDGATAGKDSVVYDVASPPVGAHVADAARLKPGEDGYVESVYDGSHVHLVQLRGGPKQAPSASRIVPVPVPAVRWIEKAEGDLLEWEQRMAAVAKEGRCDKVVVWSPGGSALSHYAVHALLNKVAISFEPDAPSVGEPFLPLDGAADVLGWEATAFARGAAMAMLEAQSGRLSDRTSLSKALAFSATGIHSATSLRSGDSAELLGGACATLLMLASAASCGESRHSKRVRNVANVDSERHQVFVRALADPLGARPLLRLALDSFACDDWSSSYGGVKWARCAAFAIDLEDALFGVVDRAFDPGGQPDVGRVVQLSHRLLNAVHNGGKLLNKFGDPKILDVAASGSLAFSTYAATYWHSLSRGPRRFPKTKVGEMIHRIRVAGAVESDVMQVWDTVKGDFVVDGASVKPAKWVLTNGRAQVRVVEPKNAVLKVQYAFDVEQEKPDPADVKKVVTAKRFKNLVKGAGYGSPGGAKPSSGGSYTSVTVKSMPLLVAMVEHAQKMSGGIEQAPSMAGTSTPYVKATKAEPLGLDANEGVRVFFGDVGVEVKP